METSKINGRVKPVVHYDEAISIGEHALVKLGEVFRISTPIMRTGGDIGEFETKDYIYKKKIEKGT